jgi:4-hydroxybenzoate polyprenyltransferase
LLRAIQFFNHSNLLVASAAAAMSAEAQILAFGFFNLVYVLLAFTSTWCAYTFLKKDHPYDNIKWKRAAATIFLLNLFLIDQYAIIVLITAAIIVMLYSPQIMRDSHVKSSFQLRRIPLLKTISIATAWVLVAVVIPGIVLSNQTEILLVDFKFLLLSFWLLTAALSIAGDLRDATIDRDKILTWPVWIGLLYTKILVCTMLALSCYFLVVSTANHAPGFLIAIVLFTLIASLSIVFIHPEKNWHKQTTRIDGLIIIHFVIVYLTLSS